MVQYLQAGNDTQKVCWPALDLGLGLDLDLDLVLYFHNTSSASFTITHFLLYQKYYKYTKISSVSSVVQTNKHNHGTVWALIVLMGFPKMI